MDKGNGSGGLQKQLRQQLKDKALAVLGAETLSTLSNIAAEKNKDDFDKLTSVLAIKDSDMVSYSSMVSQLKLTNVNVDAKDKEGRTIIMHAIANGNIKMTQALKAAGADLKAKDNMGWTPAMFALEAGASATQLLPLLPKEILNIKGEKGNTLMMQVANDGAHIEEDSHLAKMMALIGAEADVNLQNDEGKTALMFAAFNNGTEMVKTLVFNGEADVNIKDTGDRTALMFAALKGNTEMVKVLLERGAKTDPVSLNGLTALTIAEKFAGPETIEILKNASGKDLKA